MINLKLALRTLFKSPFVSLVAILSLALGIGANAAIFSLFHRLLLQPLAVAAPAQLVNFSAPGPRQGNSSCGNAGSCDEIFSYPMFRDLQRSQMVFTGIAAHVSFGVNLAFDHETINGEGLFVSGSYFPVLGLRPSVGRLLDDRDEPSLGQSPVVVLSEEYWRTHLGAAPDIAGRTIVVNGQTLTIVGVAPVKFDGTTIGARPKVFVPMAMRAVLQPSFKGMADRKSYFAYLFARLKPGVTLAQAQTAINVPFHAIVNDVEAPLQKMSPQTLGRFKAKTIALAPGERGQSSITREARAPISMLLGVTIVVLVIACANIANLLLARGAARAAEMSVRLSIGAARWQLVAQLLTESCVLAAFGGIAGVVVARWTLDAMYAILPSDARNVMTFEINTAVLLFAAALTLGTGLLFGLFPALHSTRADLIAALKGQAGQPGGARSAKRFRATLATVQIALSTALLILAGLFTKSLFNVSRVDLGLKIDRVITFGVSPALNGSKPPAAARFFERLEDALAALPGVSAVAAARVPLLSGDNWGNTLKVQGFQAGPDTDTNARYNEVSPGYFSTLGTPMTAGRDFTRADASGTAKVAIVNEAFLKKFNLGRGAIGLRIGEGGGKEPDIEIVGITQNAKYSKVKDEVPPVYFRPYRQADQTGAMHFYVRTSLDPERMLAAVPKVVAMLDANLPVEDLRTMTEQANDNIVEDRFVSVLSASFALLATLLAAIGLYGVLAYTVAQRTREIGVRMALGAAPERVRAMILGQLGRMAVVGIVIGVGAAIGLGRLAESMLYKLKGYDPLVLTGAVAMLAAVTFAAGYIPALRASRVDPMRALRYE